MSDDEESYPPPLPMAEASRWVEKHNPHPVGTYDWYLWALMFWMDQADQERRRSVWISRIALGLLFLGSLAEVGGLMIALVVSG